MFSHKNNNTSLSREQSNLIETLAAQLANLHTPDLSANAGGNVGDSSAGLQKRGLSGICAEPRLVAVEQGYGRRGDIAIGPGGEVGRVERFRHDE